MNTEEDTGPEQDFEETIEETRWALFNEYSAQSERPIGDDTGYVCPAHRWLPLVQEAAAHLEKASALAFSEVPQAIQWEMQIASFRGDGICTQLKRGDPEVIRMARVQTAAAFLQALVEELHNEGRPRPERNLKLVPQRRTDGGTP